MKYQNIKCKCMICDREFKNFGSLSNHISRTHKIKSKDYYLNYIHTDDDIKCPYCNENRKFRSLREGFYKTCGKEECLRQSMKDTCNKKYGVDYSTQSEEMKNKSKKTMLDRYDKDHYSKTDEYKKKYKKTSIERYGVDNPSKCEHIKEKIENVIMNKYGVKSYLQTEECKEKIKNILLKKYGSDHPLRCDKIKDKFKKTCMDKYGFENPSQNPDVKDRVKKTNIKNFGVEYPAKSNEIKNKMKITNIDRYNVDNYTKTDKYKELTHEINLIKYIQNVFENRPDVKLIEFTGEYYYTTYLCKWECLKCNTIFEDYARATANWLHPRCPTCNPIKYSSIENRVYNYLLTILNCDDIIRQTRQIITPYELDIYIPSLNLAVECDGDYWHSDEVLLDHYGLTYKEHCEIKRNLCEEKDIKLLNFKEYDINHNFDCVVRVIDDYLNG